MPELDLEGLADEIIRVEYPTYEQAPQGLKEAIIRKKMLIKQILRRHIEQTTEEGVKKVMKGYLIYIPYAGDEWVLLSEDLFREYCELCKKKRDKTITMEERDRLHEIEHSGESVDAVLCDLEGKKVRITVEVVEEGEKK